MWLPLTSHWRPERRQGSSLLSLKQTVFTRFYILSTPSKLFKQNLAVLSIKNVHKKNVVGRIQIRRGPESRIGYSDLSNMKNGLGQIYTLNGFNHEIIIFLKAFHITQVRYGTS